MPGSSDRFVPPNQRVGGKFQGEFTGGDELEDFSSTGTRVEFQEKSHRLYTRVPRVGEVGEKEIVFTQVSGVFKIVTKINGKLYESLLTAI